jgi:hypothetical protein
MAPNNEQDQHYGTHQYAGDQAANTRRVMNHMPDEDRSTKQEIQQHINSSQAAELAPAVRMGCQPETLACATGHLARLAQCGDSQGRATTVGYLFGVPTVRRSSLRRCLSVGASAGAMVIQSVPDACVV